MIYPPIPSPLCQLCKHPDPDHRPHRQPLTLKNMQMSKDLVLLPAFPLLLYLLLLLQFLCHTRLSQGLALAPLVCFGVEGCLQGGVPSHAGHHLLSQLSGGEWWLEKPPKHKPGPELLEFQLSGTERGFDARFSIQLQLVNYKIKNWKL